MTDSIGIERKQTELPELKTCIKLFMHKYLQSQQTQGQLVTKNAKNTLFRNGVQEVVGSNPATPTSIFEGFMVLTIDGLSQIV